MEGQPPTKNGGSNDCRKFWMSLWPSLTGKSPEHPQSGTASDQTFFYSPEEVVNFNLHLSGDVGIITGLEDNPDARKRPRPILQSKLLVTGLFIRYQSSAQSSQQRSRHLEMCQQSSKEGFFLRLFLVVHSRFHVQDAQQLFRAWDSEHVKDQTSR